MGHTLYIPRDRLGSVVKHLHHPSPPEGYPKRTSASVANTQLKQIFCMIRETIFTRTLKQLHRIIRTTGAKEQTWIQSYCILLASAMILEECQHILYMQTDKKWRTGETTKHQAENSFIRDSTHIDDSFNFLITLFHYKYKKKNRTSARLDDYRRTLRPNSPEWLFVRSLDNLTRQRRKRRLPTLCKTEYQD